MTAHAHPARQSSSHVGNPQTDALLQLLGLEHAITKPYAVTGRVTQGGGGGSGGQYHGHYSIPPPPPLHASNHFGGITSNTYLVPVQAKVKISQFQQASAVQDDNEIDIDNIDDDNEAHDDEGGEVARDHNEIDIDNVDDNYEEGSGNMVDTAVQDENEIDIDDM
jgi:hypothetical protein